LIPKKYHFKSHLYACDSRWWEHHIGDVTRDFDGELWTQDAQWEKKDDPAQWGIEKLISVAQPGLCKNKGTIHRGGNSGYQAVNLAYHLGASHILLLGFDMMQTNGKRHWFGEHPQAMNVASNYMDFTRNFNSIIPEDYGIEIWNLSRQTALTAFPVYDLDDICRD
jgi:hypothetical protein